MSPIYFVWIERLNDTEPDLETDNLAVALDVWLSAIDDYAYATLEWSS